MFNADNAIQVIAIIVSSYLIGSFPSAYLLGKLKRVNIFEVGSGNMGGTNVARSMGKGWALVTIAGSSSYTTSIASAMSSASARVGATAMAICSPA